MTLSRHTAAGRVFFMVGGLFALAMLVMGVLAFVIAERSVSRRIDHELMQHRDKYLHGDTGAPATTAEIAARIRDWQARKITSERTYSLFAPDGRMIAGRLGIRPPVGFSDVLYRGGGHSFQRGRAIAWRQPDGALFVIVQHSEIEAHLSALLPRLAFGAFVAALAAGLGATWLFAHLTARRLAATGATADAIAAAGDLSRRVPMDGLDGMFARQAESLNRMLDRMESLVETQRHFASALAHDLRTPLTRLSAMLGQDGANTGQHGAATRECAGIIATFDALLRLAEIEGGRHGGAMVDLSLGALVEDIAETMEPVIADAGGHLVTGAIAAAPIHGDPGLLSQLLINLLQNVAIHTPPGTSAHLSLHAEADEVVLVLADDGPGLAAADCTRLLRPFERGHAATERRGSGLGLSIAQAIVRFHRGRLDLADGAPGLRVRIAFPAAQGA
jgi:signal transduction histidine kinase